MPKSEGLGANLPSDLIVPLQVEPLGLWLGSLTGEEISKQISEQVEMRLMAWMKHYNIPAHSPDAYKHLCLCIADEFGLMKVTLKLPKKPKRPHPSSVWSKKDGLLVERMDKKIAERLQRGLTVSQINIARSLKKDHRPDYGHLTPKSIVNRYGEAKRSESKPHPWLKALGLTRWEQIDGVPEK